MELIKVTLSVFILAATVAYLISLVLMLTGKLIKLMGLKEDAHAAIEGTPAGQIMPPAGSDYTAIAIAVAAAKRRNNHKQ